MVNPIGKDGYGKGSEYRPVNKERYDYNYLRVYGYCNQNCCPKRHACDRYQSKAGKNNINWIPKQDSYSACSFFVPMVCQVCMGEGELRDWSNFQKKYLKTKCIICDGKGKIFPDKETMRKWIAQMKGE